MLPRPRASLVKVGLGLNASVDEPLARTSALSPPEMASGQVVGSSRSPQRLGSISRAIGQLATGAQAAFNDAHGDLQGVKGEVAAT